MVQNAFQVSPLGDGRGGCFFTYLAPIMLNYYMKGFAVSILFFALTGSLSAQEGDTLYFKDGKTMEGKKAMVKACAAVFKSELGEYNVSMNGQGMCTCLFEGLASKMTYSEFMKNITNSDFIEGISKDEKSPYRKMMLGCIISNMGSSGDDEAPKKSDKGKSDNDLIAKPKTTEKKDEDLTQIMVEACESMMATKSEGKDLGIDPHKFCTCAMEKLVAKGFKNLDKLSDLRDPNSPFFNETIVPCMNEAMGTPADKTTVTKINAADIIGKNAKEEIPITKLGKISRVKVKIGTLEKIFIIDSGASDVLISSDFERDLIFDGAISKKDYVGDKEYTIANGETIMARVYKVNGLKIGGYTINNVTVGAMDKNDISFLLGKTVLDKFSHWSINNETSKLILER